MIMSAKELLDRNPRATEADMETRSKAISAAAGLTTGSSAP